MQPRTPLTLATRARCWLMLNLVFSSTHKSFSIKLLSHWLISSMSWCLHLFPHWVQDLALLIVELREVPAVPFLQPTEVSLDGYTTLWHINHSFQFGVAGKLAKGTLCPIIPAANEAVKQGWTRRVTPGIQSLVGALQSDSMPLTTNLWSQPLNQFSSQITGCLSST